jgi:hypothetical protein
VRRAARSRRPPFLIGKIDAGIDLALGLGRGSSCDTTLRRILAEQSPAGFEETVLRGTPSTHRGPTR